MYIEDYKKLIIEQVKRLYANLFDKSDKIIELDDELKNSDRVEIQFKEHNSDITNPRLFRNFYEKGKHNQIWAQITSNHYIIINDIESEPMDGCIRVVAGDEDGLRLFTLDFEDIDDIKGKWGEPHIVKAAYQDLEDYEKRAANLDPLMAFYDDGKIKYFENEISQQMKRFKEPDNKKLKKFNKNR